MNILCSGYTPAGDWVVVLTECTQVGAGPGGVTVGVEVLL